MKRKNSPLVRSYVRSSAAINFSYKLSSVGHNPSASSHGKYPAPRQTFFMERRSRRKVIC